MTCFLRIAHPLVRGIANQFTTRSARRMPSWLAALASVWLLAGGTLAPTEAQAVIAKYVCTPAGSSSGSYCTSYYLTPWVWSEYSIGFGFTLPPGARYPSEAAILAALEEEMLDSSWCSVSLDHPNYDSTPNRSVAGIPLEYRDSYVYNVVSHKTNNPPCTQNWQTSPTLTRTRELQCPESFQLIYEAGPPVVGPYCARPWDEINHDKGCNGKCATGQVIKGDPVNVTLGGHYQAERDYRASGAFPLEFTRYYNSRTGLNYNYSATPYRSWWQPVGIGWSANYFQRLRYSNNGTLASIFAWRPDGQLITFNQQSGVFVPEADAKISIVATYDGSGNPTGFELRTENDTRETYDGDGRLLKITNSGGIEHTLTYGALGLPSSVTDSFGNEVTFEWDLHTSQLKRVTNPAGGVIDFTYSTSTKRNLLSARSRAPRTTPSSGAGTRIPSAPMRRMKTPTVTPSRSSSTCASRGSITMRKRG